MVQIWRHLRLWDVVGKYDRLQLVVGMHVYEELMIKEKQMWTSTSRCASRQSRRSTPGYGSTQWRTRVEYTSSPHDSRTQWKLSVLAHGGDNACVSIDAPSTRCGAAEHALHMCAAVLQSTDGEGTPAEAGVGLKELEWTGMVST